MAPTKFWLKRQLIKLPLFGDDDDTENGDADTNAPDPETNTSLSASVNAQSSSSVPSQSSALPSSTPSPSSVVSTPSPSPSSSSDLVETPAPSAPRAEIPVPSNPVSLSSSESVVNRLTSTTIQNRIVTVDAAVSSPLPSGVGASSNGNAFLENKVLSGVVFGLCGLVGLILIITIGFFVTRKARRNRKLEQEIISWDPDHVQTFHKKDEDGTSSVRDLEEKGRLSPTSSQQGHYTYTLPSKMQPTNPGSNYNNSAQYPAYGQPVPIHVALPATGGGGHQQSYGPPW